MLQATRRATPEATNARRGITPLDPTKREQKERGLFNFLTWPFLLAQMFAAQEFLSGGPRTAAADEERAKLANTGQNKGSGPEGDLPAASRSLRAANENESSAVPETRLDPGDRGELRESRPLEPGPDEQWATYKQNAAAGGGGSGGGGGESDQTPANTDNTGVGLHDLASDADSSGGGPLGSASALSLLDAAGVLLFQAGASLATIGLVQSVLPILHNVGALLTTATGAASSAVANTLDGVTSVLAAVPRALTGVVEPVNDIADNAVQTVSSVVDGVAPALTAATDAATDLVADAVSGAAPILAAVPQALTAITGAAGGVVQSLEPNLDSTGPALAGITDAIDGLAAGALGSASPIVQASGATLASAPGLIRDVGDQVLQIGPSTLDGIGTGLTATTAGIGEVVEGTLSSVTSVLDGSTSTFAAAVESIGGVLQGASPIVDSAGPAVTAATHALGDVGFEMADSAIDWSQPVLSFGEAADNSSNAAGPELPVVSAEVVVDPLSADLSVRSGGETFASGGVIAFSTRDARDDAADDPFGGDTHTPYGLALTINATEAARLPHAVADLDPGPSSKLTSLTDQGREHESSENRGSDLSHSTFGTVADLSSAMDDIGSRAGDLLL